MQLLDEDGGQQQQPATGSAPSPQAQMRSVQTMDDLRLSQTVTPKDKTGYRMFRKLFIVAAWAVLALIVFATVSPIHQRPTPLTTSSVEHLAAFLVLGVLFYLGYPRRLALVWLIVLGRKCGACSWVSPPKQQRAV
jgi:hypothetical protein